MITLQHLEYTGSNFVFKVWYFVKFVDLKRALPELSVNFGVVVGYLTLNLWSVQLRDIEGLHYPNIRTFLVKRLELNTCSEVLPFRKYSVKYWQSFVKRIVDAAI